MRPFIRSDTTAPSGGSTSTGVSNMHCAGSSVVRVDPDDQAEIVTCLGNMAFTPSLSFGSGVGDWDRSTLYVIDWNGKLYEVPVGVPGRSLPHP